LADALIIFPTEDIPGGDSVFLRAHQTHFRDGDLQPGVFKAQGGTGMSSDWSKYSSPEETKERAKKPSENAVLRLGVGDIRNVPAFGLDVKHVPLLPSNRAHAETDLPDKREDLTEVRLLLLGLAAVAIPIV
jgi:hypothetical protein